MRDEGEEEEEEEEEERRRRKKTKSSENSDIDERFSPSEDNLRSIQK